MRLAFYAPLKSPAHPVPSGDRNIARALIAALAGLGAGIDVASTLNSREGTGDAEKQQQIHAAAQVEIARLVRTGRQQDWAAWITYHNYYKAPDLLGPAVARALRIPYLQIESTRARSRLEGPWAAHAVAAEAASDAADVIFYVTERDAETLRRDAPAHQRLVHLPPFLDRDRLPAASPLTGPMLCVGMMREGDKLASYALLAQTLALLPADTWTLQIAGDGPARARVAALMAGLRGEVQFLGALDSNALANIYAQASLLIWPGVNEAFGMVYLEAQAAGLPVVAQNRPGVREVLAPAPYPSVEDGPQGLAEMAQGLRASPAKRAEAGAAARAWIQAHHLRPQAARTLQAGLAAVGVTL